MKTKRVRPILISTYNKVHDTYMIDRLEYQIDKKLSINGIEQELILISLEDEKIDHEKDRYFESSNGSIKTIIKAGLNIKTIGRYYNIAARQSQIPPKYISKFIEQYNSGCVEDIEIEVEGYVNSTTWEYDEPEGYNPKLTNGYITVANKQPISYSEEEVRQLLIDRAKEFSTSLPSFNNFLLQQDLDWFEQNKKK